MPLPLVSPPAEPKNQFCVLVLDLVGSTSLVQQLPLALWTELLTEWGAQMVQILERWGAWVLPLQGDSAIACWPDWQIEAALAAAQEAHAATKSIMLASVLKLPLAVHAGVAVGELSMLRRPLPYPCGLPLHLARRLSDAAAPGETLICPCAAELLEDEPGRPGSVLVKRVVPPLRGFEHLQGCEGEFYSLRTPPSYAVPGDMKAG